MKFIPRSGSTPVAKAVMTGMLCSLAILLLVSKGAAAPYRPGAVLVEQRGARALGLGHADAALINDVSAIFANPAGLADVDEYEGMLELTRTGGGDLMGGAAFAFPFQRRSTVAAAIAGMKTSEEPAAVRLGNDVGWHPYTSVLDERSLVADFALGRIVKPAFSLGAGVRYVTTDGATAVDDYAGLYGSAGFRYNSALRGIVVGGTLRNFGGRLSGAPDPGIPLIGSLGLSYGILHSTANYINLAADAVYVERRGLSPRVGVEYWWGNYLALRAGYDGEAVEREGPVEDEGWRAGMTVNFRGILIDLAMAPTGNTFEDMLIQAGMRFTFGGGRRK